MNDYTTIIITLATVLVQCRRVAILAEALKLKHDERAQDKSEQTMFRDDLRERVAVLEQKLEEAYSDKAQTERKLTEVLTKLAEYKVRLEFLEKETTASKPLKCTNTSSSKSSTAPTNRGPGKMMEPAVVEALDNARDLAGFPFVVTSGFRTIAHNRSLLKAGYPASPKSSHLLGGPWTCAWTAANAATSWSRLCSIRASIASAFPDNFIHADMDPNKTPNVLWTY